MVLTGALQCPTQVVEGQVEDWLPEAVGDRPYVLVTTAGWIGRGILDRLRPAPLVVIAEVTTNPTIAEALALVARMPENVKTIVALGGGSSIDCAKAMVFVKANGFGPDAFRGVLSGQHEGDILYSKHRIIAIPTTSGTGSEITRWGTVWDDNGDKYSVQHPSLYPDVAILDASLTLSLGTEDTLFTALDTLSHAMEAVWNRRASSLTDTIAADAINLVRAHLDGALRDGGNICHRKGLQTASLMSGLAMGATQTALAHSISYPLTGRFGVPHGLACGFTLGEVARFNMDDRLKPISAGLGCEVSQLPTAINDWFKDLGLGPKLRQWVNEDSLPVLVGRLVNPARAGNNIANATDDDAMNILTRAVKELAI